MANKAHQLAQKVDAKGKKWAKKLVKVSVDVVKEGSGSATTRKRAGDDGDSQPERKVNLSMIVAAMNHNLNQNLKPEEQPIKIRAEMRPHLVWQREAGQNWELVESNEK